MSTEVCGVCGEPADANEIDPHGHFSSGDTWNVGSGDEGSPMDKPDAWCDSLYFPYGRTKLGGVRCRLQAGHDGDHWCQAVDEMGL